MSRISNMPLAAAADVQSSDGTYLFDANGVRKDKLLTIGVLAEVISADLEVTPSGIAAGGATEGQALIFTGGEWTPGTIPTGGGGGGSGDVAGPASSVNDRVAVFSGTSGKALADGGVTISALTSADTANAAAAAAAQADADAAQSTATAAETAAATAQSTAASASSAASAASAAAAAAQADADAAQATADLKAPLASPTFTGTVSGISAAMISGFDAGVDTALATSPATARTALELGEAALLDAEDRETATPYHILTRKADGMLGDGVAADLLVSGTQILTPVAGAITHLYPLDPAVLAGRLPEVAEAEASRPLNALVSLTSANSDGDAFELIYPNPVDADVLAGMENRVMQTRLINDDDAADLTIGLAAYSAGRRSARWRGALEDVVLAPGDELLARAFWFAGDLDVDQFVRTASYATISLVSGSAEITSAINNNIPGLLTGDFPVLQICRTAGQAIAIPTDKGYAFPTAAPYGSDGRLIQATPNRSTRVAWTWAIADGDFATGNFTGATTRMVSAAYRDVAAVRQIAAAYGDASVSIAWPALPLARAPGSWVIVLLNATGLSAAVNPTGSTLDIEFDGGGGTATSHSLSHYAAGDAYAPDPTTVGSCNWAVTVLEITPRRLS